MTKTGYSLFDSLFAWGGLENHYCVDKMFTDSIRKQQHPLHKYWNRRRDETGDKVDDMVLLLNEVLSQHSEEE
jgi:hypothetical protein